MNLQIIEKTKTKTIFKIEGENHTLCNALKEELYNDKDVVAAGYFIEHPAIGVPTMVIETKSGVDAVKSMTEACKRLKKTNTAFVKAFESEIK